LQEGELEVGTLLKHASTALCAQTQTKINFESVAKQRFQNLSYGSFDLQLL
jgi:hypothetical protein